DSCPVGPCERRTREAPVWFGPSGGYLMRASPDPFPLPKNRQQKQYAARVAASWLGPALLSFQSDLRNSGEAESARRRRRYVKAASSFSRTKMPVTLPPGCERFVTYPFASGSKSTARNAIGLPSAAESAARSAGSFPTARNMSGLRAASS